MQLGVLDQSPIAEGSTPAQALHNTLDLAEHAERLGYGRYWVAEHHATPALACAAPEILIGAIASRTERIRVGSGGVMLPHYSPLKVAETFSSLSGLYPERIDLGLGRAPGTDQMTMLALQRDRRSQPGDDFIEQLAELLALLEDRMPSNHPFARHASTLPGLPERPEPWLLGSSMQSALWAAELGMGYAFADFINAGGAHIADTYRGSFVTGERLGAPRQAVAAWAIAADSEEEAQRLASSSRMVFRLMRQGRLVPVPTPEKAMRFLAAEGLDPLAPTGGRREILGTPETVRAGLETLADEYGAEEVIVVSIMHDHAARRRSYELIAEAFGLEGAAAGAAAGAGRA